MKRRLAQRYQAQAGRIQPAQPRQQRHSQPVPHHIGDRLDLVELHRLVHRDALLLQEQIHDPSAERSPVVADERLRRQQLAPGCLRHRFRHRQHHFLAQQRLPAQFRRQRERRPDQHRHVHLAGVHLPE
jgi:hypothetical protein